MQLFAHHNAAHTLGMREVVVFGIAIGLALLVIKFVGAKK